MSKVKTYQKRPVDIQAVHFNTHPSERETAPTGWDAWEAAEWLDLLEFTNYLVRYEDRAVDLGDTGHMERHYFVFDRLHNTWVEFYPGDYILKGVEGEFYPHNGELFLKVYKQQGVREHRVEAI